MNVLWSLTCVCFVFFVSMLCEEPPPKEFKQCVNVTVNGHYKYKCQTRYVYAKWNTTWRRTYLPNGVSVLQTNKSYTYDGVNYFGHTSKTVTELPTEVSVDDNEKKQTTTSSMTSSVTATPLTNEDTHEDVEYNYEDLDQSYENYCGISKTPNGKATSRIIGGIDAERNELPWQVAIEYDSDVIGGGVIIHKRWILTAAHVLLGDIRIDKYHGMIGSISLEEAAVSVQFDQIFIHPNYKNRSNNFDNDIALLHTTKEMVLYPKVENVNTACLPVTDVELKGRVTVSGFGKVNDSIVEVKRLKKVDIEILNENNCRKHFKSLYKPLLMICAGSVRGGKDSCQGDSGGPLVKFANNKAYVVGIVSYGLQKCGEPGVGAVYTRVKSYLRWIQKSIRNYKEEEEDDYVE